MGQSAQGLGIFLISLYVCKWLSLQSHSYVIEGRNTFVYDCICERLLFRDTTIIPLYDYSFTENRRLMPRHSKKRDKTKTNADNYFRFVRQKNALEFDFFVGRHLQFKCAPI